MRRVAVDFGTSNTVLGRYNDAADRAETLHIPAITRPLHYRLEANGDERLVHVVPSLIHYAEKEILIGNQVIERGLLHHRDTISWIKSRIAMGVSKRKKTAQGHISPKRAGEDFLRILLTYAADELSFSDDEFTFTAPVESFEDFEDWLRRVGENLGIQRLRIFDESTACILGYQGAIRKEDRFLIFDFGCGTLDVSAVRINPASKSNHKAVQLGQAGRDLGGLDIDTWLLKDFCERHGIDDRLRRQLEPRLLTEAEHTKIGLSDPLKPEVRFRVPKSPAGEDLAWETTYQHSCDFCKRGTVGSYPTSKTGCLGCILTEREFLKSVRETIRRALENAAIKAGMRRAEITRVVVTGGTSLVPSVRRHLEEQFEDRVDYQNPFDAVVRGACQGFVVPILQHDYAIESFNRQRRDFEFKPLFKTGTEYPTPHNTVRFWAKGSYNGMTRIGIKIFEVSEMRRRTLDVSLVDWEGVLRDSSRVATDLYYICLNRENPTFILADPPINLDRDEKRFLCSFSVDGNRRLLVTVFDNLNQKTLLTDHPVVRL